MFDLKEQIGEHKWINNYEEMTAMFCYVMNQLTWDFDHDPSQVCDDGTHIHYSKVKECIKFLQEVFVREVTTAESLLLVDSNIDMVEVMTTLEIILGMGGSNAITEFIQYDKWELFLTGLLKQFKDNGQYLTVVNLQS